MEHRLQLPRAMALPVFQPNARVLLLVEGAAACPLWPAHLGPTPPDGWCVLEQEEWESLSAFSDRLDAALSTFVVPEEPCTVALIASSFWDPASLAARHRLALEVLAHLAEAGGGHLLLSHGHQQDAVSRDSLAALAAELSPEWTDAHVRVSARVEERARRTDARKSSSSSLHAVGPAPT